MTNLYAADASVFPYIGVANPMLTITAVAYHVAAGIASTLAARDATAVTAAAGEHSTIAPMADTDPMARETA